jgi:hypothetical protein
MLKPIAELGLDEVASKTSEMNSQDPFGQVKELVFRVLASGRLSDFSEIHCIGSASEYYLNGNRWSLPVT